MNPAADAPLTGRALIVIPALNEIRHIESLLTQLLAEAGAIGGMIVVADGGSTDGTVALAKRYARLNTCVTVLHNPWRIQSAAVNLAVERFGDGHRYLIRIDAHGSYPAGYCAALIREAELRAADSVVVPMSTVGVGQFQRAVATAQNAMIGTGGSSHRTGKGGKWVEHGHHALMRVDAYREVGGYDEAFRHNEDAELDYRLTQAGHRIWLTGAVEMIYHPRATPMALFQQYFGYGGGRARNILKHRSIPRVRQMLPLAIAPAVGLAALSVFTWLAVVPALGWSVACLSMGAVAAARHEKDYGLPVSRAPLVGVAAMIMHFAWSAGFWLQLADALTGRGRRP
jgi:succinoglycan biosynthesis protein ExoA